MSIKPCNSSCPKCGSKDVCLKFRKKGDYLKDEDFEKSNDFIRVDPKGEQWPRAKKDHLNKVCRCCNYEWQTDTL